MADPICLPAFLTGVEILAIGIGILALVGVLLAFFLIRSLVRLFQELRNSVPSQLMRDLTQDIESGEFMRRAQEPVSLSGMERIYGPMIQRDFPELNLEELKRRAERLAYTTLTAIDQENPSLLSESSEMYRMQVGQHLASLASVGRRERFSDITLHRIVLSNYQKQAGTSRISFQLAVGANYKLADRAADSNTDKDDGQQPPIADGPQADRSFDQQGDIQYQTNKVNGVSKRQFAFEIDALYIQDLDALATDTTEARAFNCPNCGAPVPGLGDLQCQYCGSAIEPINVRVWTFSRFNTGLS